MMTRQQFIHAGAALVAAPFGLVACAPVSYEDAAKKTWRHMSGPYQGELALKQELVR